MKIKVVEIALGLTLSPRQYESVRVDGRVVVELDEQDNEQEAFGKARVALNNQVEEQMAYTMTRIGVGPPSGKPGDNGRKLVS